MATVIAVLLLTAGVLLILFHRTSMNTLEVVKTEIVQYLPLTADSFREIFKSQILRYSEYGEELHNCFIDETSFPEKPSALHIRALITLNVARSTPPATIDVYHDDKTGNPCYRANVQGSRSWLICFRDGNVVKLMSEISNLCGRYSEPLRYGFPFF